MRRASPRSGAFWCERSGREERREEPGRLLHALCDLSRITSGQRGRKFTLKPAVGEKTWVGIVSNTPDAPRIRILIPPRGGLHEETNAGRMIFELETWQMKRNKRRGGY